MSKPIIAIVGRPNVGKSTLFNKLIGERRSIVEDIPGVTRDRIYGETEWGGKKFIVIDTGGIEPKTDDIILSQMRFQAQIAIESADVVLMRDEVGAIAKVIRLAKKTVRVVRQNVVFALFVKFATLILSAIGIANMWLAIFADVGVAVLAILNAMRMLKKPQ